MNDHPVSKIKCKQCGNRMTWAARRVQWGRVKRHGLSDDEIKALLPRCQKCMTVALKLRAESQPAEPGIPGSRMNP